MLALPGVGDYTARAVPAFAYGQRHPVVDTNVRRVAARAVHGLPDAGAATTPADLTLVESLLPQAEPAGGAGQRGVHGTGRGAVHGAYAPVRGLPAAGAVRVAALGRGRCRRARPASRSVTRAPTARCAGCCWRCCGTRRARWRSRRWTWCGRIAVQRERALDSLLADGLVVPRGERFGLPGRVPADI